MPREDRRYVYDAAWNLSCRTNNTTLYTFKVDTKNQLTNATPVGNQAYDGNGNVTSSESGSRTFAYDDENRLTTNELGFNLRSVFTYDGLGRLRQRQEYTWAGSPYFQYFLTDTVRYIYDGMRVIQERNDSNVPTVSYTRGSDLSGSLEGAGGIGGLLARSHGYSSGNWSTHNFYHADGGGNITYLVNSSQGLAASYKYDAYGNLVSQSGSLAGANVYRFSSKEWLATPGLYYYGYRFYSPSLQRWLNRDPLGEAGFELLRRAGMDRMNLDPNLYLFVRNDPVGYHDPYGLSFAGTANPGTAQQVCQVLTITAGSIAAAIAAIPATAIVVTTAVIGGAVVLTYAICEAPPAPARPYCEPYSRVNAPPTSVSMPIPKTQSTTIPRWRPPPLFTCEYECPDGYTWPIIQNEPCAPVIVHRGMVCVLKTPFPGPN